MTQTTTNQRSGDLYHLTLSGHFITTMCYTKSVLLGIMSFSICAKAIVNQDVTLEQRRSIQCHFGISQLSEELKITTCPSYVSGCIKRTLCKL